MPHLRRPVYISDSDMSAGDDCSHDIDVDTPDSPNSYRSAGGLFDAMEVDTDGPVAAMLEGSAAMRVAAQKQSEHSSAADRTSTNKVKQTSAAESAVVDQAKQAFQIAAIAGSASGSAVYEHMTLEAERPALPASGPEAETKTQADASLLDCNQPARSHLPWANDREKLVLNQLLHNQWELEKLKEDKDKLSGSRLFSLMSRKLAEEGFNRSAASIEYRWYNFLRPREEFSSKFNFSSTSNSAPSTSTQNAIQDPKIQDSLSYLSDDEHEEDYAMGDGGTHWTTEEKKILKDAAAQYRLKTNGTERGVTDLSQLMSHILKKKKFERSAEACRKQWERLQRKENAKEAGAGTNAANPHHTSAHCADESMQAEPASHANAEAVDEAEGEEEDEAEDEEEFEGDEWSTRESQAFRDQVAICRSLLTLDNEDDFFKAISSMLLRNMGIDRNFQACKAHFRYLEALDNPTAIEDVKDNSHENFASGVDDVAEDSVDDQTRVGKSGLKETPASKPSTNVTVATKKGLEDVQPEVPEGEKKNSFGNVFRFSKEQRAVLEREATLTMTPSKETMNRLSTDLEVEIARVKSFFNNARSGNYSFARAILAAKKKDSERQGTDANDGQAPIAEEASTLEASNRVRTFTEKALEAKSSEQQDAEGSDSDDQPLCTPTAKKVRTKTSTRLVPRSKPTTMMVHASDSDETATPVAPVASKRPNPHVNKRDVPTRTAETSQPTQKQGVFSLNPSELSQFNIPARNPQERTATRSFIEDRVRAANDEIARLEGERDKVKAMIDRGEKKLAGLKKQLKSLLNSLQELPPFLERQIEIGESAKADQEARIAYFQDRIMKIVKDRTIYQNAYTKLRYLAPEPALDTTA